MTQETNIDNSPPGFLCPVCKNVRIKIPLETFLNDQEIICPSCGSPFYMDKSRCGRLIELLQDLHVAEQNLNALKKQSF